MTSSLIEYRKQPLAPEDYDILDKKAGHCLSFRERTTSILKWEKDEYGDLVQRRIPMPAGPEVFKKGEVSDALYASLTRPVHPTHLAVHLTNLSYHKPWTRGTEAWRVVVADLMADLEGVSEYAVIKIFEMFRRDPDLHYFPDTAVLIKRVRDLDWSLKNVNVDKPAPRPQQREEPQLPVKNQKSRKRVAQIMKIGGRAPEKWTRWEKRFMDAIKAKADADRAARK